MQGQTGLHTAPHTAPLSLWYVVSTTGALAQSGCTNLAYLVIAWVWNLVSHIKRENINWWFDLMPSLQWLTRALSFGIWCHAVYISPPLFQSATTLLLAPIGSSRGPYVNQASHAQLAQLASCILALLSEAVYLLEMSVNFYSRTHTTTSHRLFSLQI
jgi:hypothetical protein